MGGRMSRRRNILHAAGDFAVLLHEPGSVGDLWQVLSSCPYRCLLERVGHRRTFDLAFVTAAGPVVPLRIDKDELSLRKRQRARFRHQAADMVQVTMRRHDQIDALWRDPGPAQVRLEPGKAAEGWAEFLTKARIDKDTLPSRVDHQHVVRDLDHRLHEVCLQHRSELSFRGIHSEDRPDRKLPIAIRDHGRLEVADLEAIEAIAVLGFRTGLTGAVRPGGGGEQPRRRCGNSQPGAGTKHTATGQDRRGFDHVYLQLRKGALQTPPGRWSHLAQPQITMSITIVFSSYLSALSSAYAFPWAFPTRTNRGSYNLLH